MSKISAFCDEQFLVAVIFTLIFFSSLSHHFTFHKSFYLSHFFKRIKWFFFCFGFCTAWHLVCLHNLHPNLITSTIKDIFNHQHSIWWLRFCTEIYYERRCIGKRFNVFLKKWTINLWLHTFSVCNHIAFVICILFSLESYVILSNLVYYYL